MQSWEDLRCLEGAAFCIFCRLVSRAGQRKATKSISSANHVRLEFNAAYCRCDDRQQPRSKDVFIYFANSTEFAYHVHSACGYRTILIPLRSGSC